MSTGQAIVTHPGTVLRDEFMRPLGLSAYALAKALSVPLPRVNDIVREKRAISPEMAVLLATYFGTTSRYWVDLQAHFDLLKASGRIADKVACIKPHPRDDSGALRPTDLGRARRSPAVVASVAG